MPYINSTKEALNVTLYYKDFKTLYSLELAIKYINKKTKFKENSLKALSAIKSIILLENIKRFSNRKDAKEL
jgi:hypothetical protein